MTSGSYGEHFYPNSTADYLTITGYDLDAFFSNYSNTSTLHVTLTGRDLWREIPLGIVLTLLCILTTAGNAMVLHAVRTERRLQTVSTTCNNLCTSCTCIPIHIMYMYIHTLHVYIHSKKCLLL